MSETYAAWWPIHDDTRTFNELTPDALEDLKSMVDAIGYSITGWIKWETDEWPDAGLVLLAVAPVEPLPQTSQVVKDVVSTLEQDPTVTTPEMAARLNIKTGSLYMALRRAGRQDLTRRLSRNTPQTAGGASTLGQSPVGTPREGPRGRNIAPVDVPAPPLPTTEEER